MKGGARFGAQGADAGGPGQEDDSEAALFFVNHNDSFGGAMSDALSFAGPANYAPVLVGALAGARFGYEAIPRALLAHCRPGVEARLATAAAILSKPG